jgi:luciferase family oxidoreductase group 1
VAAAPAFIAATAGEIHEGNMSDHHHPDVRGRLPLAVLDLCKRRNGASAGQAMRDTIALARTADQLGFSRYWLAEHHVSDSAVTAPETLLALIGEQAKDIRIGFGGVVLNYYSPYRVVEIVSSLQALIGPRIDLGLCRGPGLVDERIADELVSGNQWELQTGIFERKVCKTFGLVDRGADTLGVKIYPPLEAPPQRWLLASSPETASFASDVRASFAVPLFIIRDEQRAHATMQRFHDASARSGAARGSTALAVSIVCAEDHDLAGERHRRTIEHGSIESNLVGTFEAVAAEIHRLKDVFFVDEIFIVSFAPEHEERIETYSRLADFF